MNLLSGIPAGSSTWRKQPYICDTTLLRLSDEIDIRYIAQMQADIAQSRAAWERIIAGRPLSTINKLKIKFSFIVSLPEAIGQLSSLQSLEISDNAHLSSLPAAIGQLTNLQSLEIGSNTQLSSLPKSLLQRKDNLKEFDLSRTAISAEEVEYWKGVLPNTRIISDYD